MAKLTYNGPHDAVEIPDLEITVAQGEQVDVDDPTVVEALTAAGFTTYTKPRSRKTSEE